MSIDVNVQNDLVIVTESSEDITVNVSNAAGPAGVGVPTGGSTGQVLKKASATNYDTYWAVEGGGVPYSGATGDVDLGEYELKAGQVEFDQTPTGTAGVGVMRWNDADGTVDLGLKGGNVTLQVGQEQVLRVVNKTGADLLESQYRAVRIRLVSEGGSQGQRLAVVLAQGDNDPDSTTTIGIVTENIDNNQDGFITTSGEVRGINTTGSLQGETWVDGDIIYLSPTIPGGITKVKPTAPQHLLQLGYVIYAHNVNGKIFVKIDNGYELSELHDVYAPSPTDGQGIFWNTANLRYQNNTVAGILGYTPVPTTRTLTINGTAYDLSADRSWTVSAAANTIYTADGTLTGNRVVTMGGKTLTFKEASTSLYSGIVIENNGTESLNLICAGVGYGIAAWANNSVLASTKSLLFVTNTNIGSGGSGTFKFSPGGYGVTEQLTIGNSYSTFSSPSGNYELTINTGGTNTLSQILFKSTTSTTNGFILSTAPSFTYGTLLGKETALGSYGVVSLRSNDTGYIRFMTGNADPAFSTEKARITSAGRLLLGTTTESTYILDAVGNQRISGNLNIGTINQITTYTGSNYLFIGYGHISSSNDASPDFGLSQNVYYNGTNNIYTRSGFSNTFYLSQFGHFQFYTTASGIAGATATLNEKMRLTNSGRLLLGLTSESTFLLDVNGTARVSGALTVNANSTTGTLKLNSGDTNTGASGFAQIALSFQGTQQYNAFITTNHGGVNQNTIKFFTSGGIANNTLSTSILGLTILDGSGYFESILSAKTEIRLFEPFRRIAVPLSNGSYAGGFNVKIVSDVLQLDTGPVSGAAGYSYGQDGSTNFFNLPISSVSTPLIQTFKIFNNGNVQIQNGGTFTDISSARLQVNSTTQGFLPPRMTTTQKNAIGTPAAGLMVFDTTLVKLCVYNGTAWETITSI